MSEPLKLPYFTQDEHDIKYLGQYSYMETDGLDLATPVGRKILMAEGIYVHRPDLPASVDLDDRRVVILEPHPDDLALSASGYVFGTIAAGGICRAINLFSRTAIDRFPWQGKVAITEDDFETLRLQEGRIAIEEFLQQQFISLRLPLASKRGYEEIFAEEHRDQELVGELSAAIAESVVEFGADTLLCPMAVQGHIDHLVTFDVGVSVRRLLGDDIDLILYEDYPYARNKNAYGGRLRRVQEELQLAQEYVAVDAYLGAMADMAIIYRSQFDDINRDQMHAIMREDLRAVALEAKAEGFLTQAECAQRYWRAYEA